MRFGAYNAVLHHLDLASAIDYLETLGLDGIEINSGGFLPATHVPDLDLILTSDTARDELLGVFEGKKVQIAGLNCNGNPLHPNPTIREKHADDVRKSILLANRLGQTRVVTMSGLPAGEPGGSRANWVVNAWNSAALDVIDYQFDIAAKFWGETDRLARDLDVKVALELHPQNVVFNPATMRELIERAKTTNIGVELDASHLFWQQMDPIAVVKDLGELVFHAAAKDIRINPQVSINGVLDNSFRKMRHDENRTNLGDDEWVNEWPKYSSWDFVAVGKGHPIEYWADFISALNDVDPNMICNLEHEDAELAGLEGLEFAAKNLLAAASQAGLR